jgi:hypothetical protein
MLAAVAVALPAAAGPIFAYRDGPQYCPRDRAPDAPPIDGPAAMQRALALLPAGFCGPSAGVDGCDVDAEAIAGTFRVYAHQYKLRDGRHDWTRLTHTYVILDRVGNCIAHIPGTGALEGAQ